MVQLIDSVTYEHNDGINETTPTYSFFFVPAGEFIWVDGVACPDKVGAENGIHFAGCKRYPHGAFVVGHQCAVNYARNDILHIHTPACEVFNNKNAARAYYKRNTAKLSKIAA